MIKKILVVEDDPQIRTNLIDLLELSEYTVFSASNGKEGVKIAFELLPDLVISDIMMPQMDGYEFKKALSLNPGTKSIPFIFLTAKSDIADFRTGMDLGADDYLIKPINLKELIKAIEVREQRLNDLLVNSKAPESNNVLAKEDVYEKQIMLDTGIRQELIKPKEIMMILAEGDYTKVVTSESKKILIRKRLKDWEDSLPKNKFLKVHRSTIVNIDYITKIEKLDSRSFLIRVKGYEKAIPVSQRNATKLKEQLSL
ncbi:MAG: response regulator transcription factor [Melioribacteraceae bacterium]|nr:response regulator transcription factor [Melioribacteraceae bacterium]